MFFYFIKKEQKGVFEDRELYLERAPRNPLAKAFLNKRRCQDASSKQSKISKK